MKKTLFVLLCSAFTLISQAADNYTVDARHTFPSFEINHLGFSIQRGRFNQTTGNIVLDPKSPNGGSVKIAIDPTSIDTGLAELESHLRGPDFLDTDHYPKISFNSTQLQFKGDQLIGIDGDFNLHGITKPVHLTLNHFNCGLNPLKMKITCGANALSTLKRSDFGINKYIPMIADEMNIMIQIEAIKD